MNAERGHGPGELIAIRFDGSAVPDEVRDAFLAAVDADVVRLLDLLVVTVDADRTITTIEPEDLGDLFDVGSFELDEQGLVGAEDAETIAETLAPGQTALVLLLEHRWARAVAYAVRATGGNLIATERIPAAVLDDLALAAAN